MSYLKDIEELYDERWKEAKERAEQFFETYFTSTDVSPQQNQSSYPSQCIIDIETSDLRGTSPGKMTVAFVPNDTNATIREYSKDEPRKHRKGFTPEAREALIERLKASGHTVMTADGRIDPSSSRYKSEQGSFRRTR